ncbi:hypothetical protein KKB71_02290 [Patescibacteria group bacterium]|nr:hypothetical protein [Patescibacteria group bacterium]
MKKKDVDKDVKKIQALVEITEKCKTREEIETITDLHKIITGASKEDAKIPNRVDSRGNKIPDGMPRWHWRMMRRKRGWFKERHDNLMNMLKDELKKMKKEGNTKKVKELKAVIKFTKKFDTSQLMKRV